MSIINDIHFKLIPDWGKLEFFIDGTYKNNVYQSGIIDGVLWVAVEDTLNNKYHYKYASLSEDGKMIRMRGDNDKIRWNLILRKV